MSTPLPADVESLLIEQIRERKKMWRVGSLTMIGMMLVFAAIAHFAFSSREAERIIALCGLGGIVGAVLFLPSLGSPKNAKILVTLRERAHDIVWMYVVKQTGQAAQSWVAVFFADGTRAQVTASLGKEDAVLNALVRLAPSATLGFSPELQARFAQAPASLRRAA
jgi:hypothetical protein